MGCLVIVEIALLDRRPVISAWGLRELQFHRAKIRFDVYELEIWYVQGVLVDIVAASALSRRPFG